MYAIRALPESLFGFIRASTPSNTEKPAPRMKIPNAASSDQK